MPDVIFTGFFVVPCAWDEMGGVVRWCPSTHSGYDYYDDDDNYCEVADRLAGPVKCSSASGLTIRNVVLAAARGLLSLIGPGQALAQLCAQAWVSQPLPSALVLWGLDCFVYCQALIHSAQ